MMVRSEQVVPAADGVRAEVVDSTYFGHEQVRRSSSRARPRSGRAGTRRRCVEPGDVVYIRVDGEARAFPRDRHDGLRRRPPPPPGDVASAVLLFAVLAVLLHRSIGLRASRGASITGDEPFYLVTTQSLLQDGDLDLRSSTRAHVRLLLRPRRATVAPGGPAARRPAAESAPARALRAAAPRLRHRGPAGRAGADAADCGGDVRARLLCSMRGRRAGAGWRRA